MARFSDNPIKNPLAGTEIIPATDPSTTDDIGMTPQIISNYAQSYMSLATGSTQGLISGPQADKLAALPSDAQLNELLEVAFPFFAGTPSNGTQTIYTHLLDPFWEFIVGYGQVSAGSTNLTVNINGTPIAGWNSIPITTAGATFTTPNDATCKLQSGSQISVTLAGTTGNCANLMFSMRANQSLT
jgi:hypothetical protein